MTRKVQDTGLDDDYNGLIEDGIKKPKRRSRWVKGSGVPRYDKKAQGHIDDTYLETPDWHHGALIGKQEVKSK